MHAWSMHVGICLQGMHAPTHACMARAHICMPRPMCTSIPHPTGGGIKSHKLPTRFLYFFFIFPFVMIELFFHFHLLIFCIIHSSCLTVYYRLQLQVQQSQIIHEKIQSFTMAMSSLRNFQITSLEFNH